MKVPDDMHEEDVLFLSDIFPTSYFGADLAEIKSGDTVAVFGCGPVGQFAIASAKLQGAGRIFAVDCVETLEEIGMRGQEEFREAGGENLTLIPCVNSNLLWIKAGANLIRKTAQQSREPGALTASAR